MLVRSITVRRTILNRGRFRRVALPLQFRVAGFRDLGSRLQLRRLRNAVPAALGLLGLSGEMLPLAYQVVHDA